ncbi:MAG: flagellar hook capping FlgD N-terminal domain-containing protein [Chthoniobacteraceae bacterium]|nr:flagellar hook capping FlgD N-terminal domain-containing protein [Chthoniobacteraceae bacterium]
MSVTSTNSSTASNASALDLLNQQTDAAGKPALDENDFFKLLTAQLAAQDPLNPMDDTSFISQMASFSSLQQMQALSENMAAFTQQQGVANASNYLGKTVTVLDEDGNNITGVVSAVSVDSGTPKLIVNGAAYGIDAVTNVAINQPTADSTPGTGAQ